MKYIYNGIVEKQNFSKEEIIKKIEKQTGKKITDPELQKKMGFYVDGNFVTVTSHNGKIKITGQFGSFFV